MRERVKRVRRIWAISVITLLVSGSLMPVMEWMALPCMVATLTLAWSWSVMVSNNIEP